MKRKKQKKSIKMFYPNGFRPLYPIIEKIYIGLQEKYKKERDDR